MDDETMASLGRAVEAAPEDAEVRMVLADALAHAGRYDEAVRHAAAVLAGDPRHAAARTLVLRGGRPEPGEVLARLEEQFADDAPLVAGPAEDATPATGPRGLEDVAGMAGVKRRLEEVYFGPLRNPSLARVYGLRAGGGLLLYGPPGCGKTHLARAVAAEVGAQFLQADAADLLSRWLGHSEQNVDELFADAARRAPCVVFLDELDAVGQRRSSQRGSAGRTAVNQLLVSMERAAEAGVLVVAATNHPWDVDPALRRPGRLDRSVLVPPPDSAARAQILRMQLAQRPAEDVDVTGLVAATAGFSGADLVHVCTTAVQRALADAMRTGQVRPVTDADLRQALSEVRPSTAEWFDTARPVVRFGRGSGEYDELRAYMKQEGLL